MNAKSKPRILAIISLIFPALIAAFPADSLLLVQVTSLSAASDTFWVQKYAYSRDDQGFWHENMSEYRDDTLSSERFKTYDAGGHAVAESSYTRGLAGPVRISVRAEYDAAGKPLRATTIENDSLRITSDYQYDASGKLQKLTLSSVDPAFTTFYAYEYDGQGRVSEQKRYLRDSVRETTRYGYDGNGREASVTLFGGNVDTSEVTTLEYDASGRLTRKVSRYLGDSTAFLFADARTEYDAAGNVATVKGYRKDGSLEHTDIYAYRSLSVPLPIIASRARRGPKAPGWITSGSAWDLLGRLFPLGKSRG